MDTEMIEETTEEKPKRKRAKKPIDLQQVEEMSSEFCTQDEIASDMGFSTDLFTTREDVREAFTKGKNQAKMSVRHQLFNHMMSGNLTAAMFLAKHELGYRDNVDPKEEKKEDLNAQALAIGALIANAVQTRTIEGVMNEGK